MAKKVGRVKKLETRLRPALRQLWLRSAQRYAHIKAARIAPGLYKCAVCGGGFKVNEINVDHHPDVGAFTMDTIGDWINRLFYGPQRVLCKPCHKEKK